MKKIIVSIVLVALVGGLAWLVWFKPAHPEEEEAKSATEVPVQVTNIIRATLRGYVTAYGLVEPEPAGERPAASARIMPNVAGVVAAVSCVEGQKVEKGAILIQLDSRAANVTADKTRQAAAFAEQNLDRQKKLIQADATSQKLLLEAEQALNAARSEAAAAQTQQALLRIQAPLAGTVTHLNVKPGEAVDLTTVAAEVIDLERLVVSANVPSPELAALKTGQPVEVSAEQTTHPLKGTLAFISSQVDPKAGTALVRASLPAPSGLLPGQFVTLRIVVAEHQDRLAVPIESVVKDAEGNPVIAVVQNNTAVQKPVKEGLRDGGLAEVEGDGLQAGMMVVTYGAYGLPKETKVRLPAEASPPEKSKAQTEPSEANPNSSRGKEAPSGESKAKAEKSESKK